MSMLKQKVLLLFQNWTIFDTMTEPTSRTVRVLRVLERLSAAGHPQTLSQLTQSTGVPKSSLMRMLDELEQYHYIVRVPGKAGYVTGHKVHHLALVTLQAPELLRACRDVLRRLVATTGETCNLNAMVGDEVKYLAREESPGQLRLQLRLPVGTHVPLHCTASGKLFLARRDRKSTRLNSSHLAISY